jgi:hypothetical protein
LCAALCAQAARVRLLACCCRAAGYKALLALLRRDSDFMGGVFKPVFEIAPGLLQVDKLRLLELHFHNFQSLCAVSVCYVLVQLAMLRIGECPAVAYTAGYLTGQTGDEVWAVQV